MIKIALLMIIIFAQYCRKLDQNLLKLGFGVLFYELHAHYGVALAHIGDHRKAVREFTFAIEAVSAPKVRGGYVFSSGGYGSTLEIHCEFGQCLCLERKILSQIGSINR